MCQEVPPPLAPAPWYPREHGARLDRRGLRLRDAGQAHRPPAPPRLPGRRLRPRGRGRRGGCPAPGARRPRRHAHALRRRPQAEAEEPAQARDRRRGDRPHVAHHGDVRRALLRARPGGAPALRRARPEGGADRRLRALVLEHGVRDQGARGSRGDGGALRVHRHRHPRHAGRRGRRVPRGVDGQGAVALGARPAPLVAGPAAHVHHVLDQTGHGELLVLAGLTTRRSAATPSSTSSR